MNRALEPSFPAAMTISPVSWLAACTLAWLLAARAAGVFRPRAIDGPSRGAAGGERWPLVTAMLVGIAVFILVPSVYVASKGVVQASAPAASLPTGGGPGGAPAAPIFSPSETVLLNSLGALAGFVTVLGMTLTLRPGTARHLGFTWRQFPGGFWRGAVGIVLALPFVTAVSVFAEWLIERLGVSHPPAVELLEILGSAPQAWVRVLVVVSAAILAPLFEETLFRGHLQTLLGFAFRRRRAAPPAPAADSSDAPALPLPPAFAPPVPWPLPYFVSRPAAEAGPLVVSPGGRWAAVVATSLLFALVHPWWTMPPIFALSLCLGYAYERTGNLWVPITMHALFNSTSLAYFLLVAVRHGG